MAIVTKLRKLAQLLRNPLFANALVRHHVAAATEHLDAIRFCAPTTLIDVGANKGQFATAVRGLMPNAEIHAFEPLPAAAAVFERLFVQAPKVKLYKMALGGEGGVHQFFVTDREDSSSLLKPGSNLMTAMGVSEAARIDVNVSRLSDVLDLSSLAHPILMKIDVQGTELDVLRGCCQLDHVDYIFVELSFVELYEGQCLFEDVRHFLSQTGFIFRGTFNPAFKPAFGPTQADCLFVNAHRRPDRRGALTAVGAV